MTGTVLSLLQLDQQHRSLDQNASIYLLNVITSRNAPQDLPYSEILWALHSSSQDAIIDICKTHHASGMRWCNAKALGIGYWLRNPERLVRS